MAREQARAGLKVDRKKSPREAKAAADDEAPKPSLSETNKLNFKIGDSSVDVVLSGANLDDPKLDAAFLVKNADGTYAEPGAAGWVVFVTPDRGNPLFDEFPISVKVAQAPPGTYYFAVGRYIIEPGPPPKRKFVAEAVLGTHSIEFYVTSPKGQP